MSEIEDPGCYVTVARVLRARGNRGEVAAQDLSDDPKRFVAGSGFQLLASSGDRLHVVLENAWYHQGRLILKFEGIETISQAESLRGLEVQIPQAELGPAPEGEYYYQDLIGCQVIDAADDRVLGVVEAIQEPGGGLLLQVRSGAKEILIPFVRSVCVEIAPQQRKIRVRLPEGLEDLNG